ncbi:hypothetical protein D1165_18160 [Muribaculaceae bacterium M3]|nr:hypothetical protein [Muribaculaceae bacterium M3]
MYWSASMQRITMQKVEGNKQKNDKKRAKMHETRQVIFNGRHTKRDTSTKHNAHKGDTRARP